MSDILTAIFNFFQGLFSPIVSVLSDVLEFFHWQLGLPWWLAIVTLTVIVRTVLFPLTVRQVRSMRAMQELKPEMDRIRARYRDNREMQRQEMMKLYQERNVNPLGGCLPLLVQMPIFLGMFYVIRYLGGDPNARPPQPPEEPSFAEGGILWFQDLAHADPTGLLPILSAVTMLAGMEITNKYMEPQQRWIMRALPIMFIVFLWAFPAGLFVYWITSNVFTLGQNYLIYYHGPGKKPAEGSAPEKRRAAEQNGARKGGSGDSSPANGSEEYTATLAAKKAKRKRRKKRKR